MNEAITFTPAELVAVIIGLCTAIVTISGAIGVVIKVIDRARQPEQKQNDRLTEIEGRLTKIDNTIVKFKEYFANDDNRFKAIEKSNKITQRALLGLLKHTLNGNDTESLKEAEKSLEEYLIDK